MAYEGVGVEGKREEGVEVEVEVVRNKKVDIARDSRDNMHTNNATTQTK